MSSALRGVAFVAVMLCPAVTAVATIGRGAQLFAAITIGGVTAFLMVVAVLSLNLSGADSGRILAAVAAVAIGVVSFGVASVAALLAFGLRNRR